MEARWFKSGRHFGGLSCIAELLKEVQTLIGIKALLPNEGLRSVRLMK